MLTMASKETAAFLAEGMMCASCEQRVKKAAESVEGVYGASVDYKTGKGKVIYDPEKTSIDRIFKRIRNEGYSCSLPGVNKSPKDRLISAAVSVILVIAGAYLLFGGLFEAGIPDIGQDASLFLIFTLGLVTGFHCVAMCGGFVVSYSTKEALKGDRGLGPHLIYGGAKTLSYTLIGGLFGLIGSFIVFTPALKGIASAVAGLFLMLYGADMLGLIRFRLGSGPALMEKLTAGRSGNPAFIGLANGLMIACGPLQAMYVLAAASGSAFTGALYLLVYGLGTLPVLLGFGVLTSVISSRFTNRILRYSGIIVILLGLVMLNRGMVLAGTGYDLKTIFGGSEKISTTTTLSTLSGSATSTNNPATSTTIQAYQVIYMNVTAAGWQPDTFTLKKGVPVRWVIDGQEITGCNKAIQVPKLGLSFDIKKGEQTIEFTPKEAEVIPWSCWVGMIQGKFIVVN